MTIENVIGAQAAYRESAARYSQECEQFINDHCPVKVGDVITSNISDHLGRKFTVENIRLETPDLAPAFYATGTVLRSEGYRGSRRATWREAVQ